MKYNYITETQHLLNQYPVPVLITAARKLALIRETFNLDTLKSSTKICDYPEGTLVFCIPKYKTLYIKAVMNGSRNTWGGVSHKFRMEYGKGYGPTAENQFYTCPGQTVESNIALLSLTPRILLNFNQLVNNNT